MAIMNRSINLVKFNKGKYRVLQSKKNSTTHLYRLGTGWKTALQNKEILIDSKLCLSQISCSEDQELSGLH